MNILYKTFTEIGLKRKTNQDRITAHTSKNISLFAVADGMGGHSDGEYASETMIKNLDALWKDISNFSGDFQTAVDMVISALKEANTEIFRYAKVKKIICGSTVSVLLVCGKFYAVINIGDSPVYYADKKNFVHASTEHTYGNIMQKSTIINPDSIDVECKNRLVKAIGIKENIYPSVRTGKIKSKTAFLLCSDGISRYLTDKQICGYLRCTAAEKIDISEMLNILKNIVYRMGAEDNLSAIAIYYRDYKNYRSDRRIISVIISAAIIFFILWAVINIFILL